MNSVQESKQELQAAIRYAENAISSANATIESMEFRQEMAKKQYADKTGREQALEREIAELNKQVKFYSSKYNDLCKKNEDLEAIIQGQADDEQVLRQRIEGHRTNMALLTDEVEKLRKEKQASSGSCGCQGYRDLHDEAARLKSDNLRLKASLDAASEQIKDMREDLNDQIKLDEEVRQGINDFLDFLDDIDYERP